MSFHRREDVCRATYQHILESEKDIQIVREVHSGNEALQAAMKFRPDILVLDWNLLGVNVSSLLPSLIEAVAKTKTILLTRRSSAQRILNALSYGAHGYIAQTSLQAFLVKAVRIVCAGESWVPRKMLGKILEQLVALMSRQP